MQAFRICSLLLLFVACAYAAQLVYPLKCNGQNEQCGVESVHYFSSTNGLMVTSDNRAWQTTDQGLTWTLVASKVNSMEYTSANPQIVFLMPTSNTNVTFTTDGGGSFNTLVLPVGVGQYDYLHLHPSQKGWLFIVSCNFNSQKCTLFTTKNYGSTWTTCFQNAIAYEGVNNPVIWGNSTTEPDLMFVLLSSFKFGYTKDYKTFKELFPDVLGFKRTQYYYWVLAYDDTEHIKLYSSSYRADPTHMSPGSYKLAAFPGGEEFFPDDYQFLDDTTRAEYIGIHMEGKGNYGNLYTSQFDGLNLELSLPNVYLFQGYYDFHRVRGLAGIYIANVMPDVRTPGKLWSVITFDNGGDWRLLTPPATDMNGNPWPCASQGIGSMGCALHLHGEAGVEYSGVQSIHSSSSAIGLVIANGNVGPNLVRGVSSMSTFLSRDGGLTWTQIYAKASLFSFGDHGGIIVLAPNAMTSYVYYSYTQGITGFQQSPQLPAPMSFYGISTETNGTGRVFTFWGQNYNGTSDYYYFFAMDLSDDNIPDCVDSDFENFVPTNTLNGNCFMGQTFTYTRRKATAVCYNNKPNTDTLISSTPCACTWEDYECAPNYSPSTRNDSNGFSCTKQFEDLANCVNGQNTYYNPTGYQLVPDTMCTTSNGLDLIGPEHKCHKSSNTGGVITGVLITLIIVGAIASVVVLYFKNDKFREWVQSLSAKSEGRGGQKYRGLTSNEDPEDDDDATA